MRAQKTNSALLLLAFLLAVWTNLDAKSRHRSRGPLPAHPTALWAKTISESKDQAARLQAAFKFSRYSQPIYQEPHVRALISCTSDPVLEMRVYCVMALAKANQQKHTEIVREALLARFKKDPALRGTITRALRTREDNSPEVLETLMAALGKTQSPDEINALLDYFHSLGEGTDSFVQSLVTVYRNNKDSKIRRDVIKTLAERAQGQDAVVALFSECATDSHTPLALLCLSGLQTQAKNDKRALQAVEKAIHSDDPDMVLASLEVIQSMPETRHPEISSRLLQLIRDSEDSELQEKAIVALGASGDQSQKVVEELIEILSGKSNGENVRIASALALGKQGPLHADISKSALKKCEESGMSKSLTLACTLGLQDLDKLAPKASE